jgi:CHAD domain-containing protein
MPEAEAKLVAPPGFELPDLGGDGLKAEVRPVRRYTTVYWDTPDLRLAAWGSSLRHRDDEGWTVKLPPGAGSAGPMVVRDEITFDGIPSAVPDEAAALVSAFTRGAPLAPVARLDAVRQPVVVTSEHGGRLAEVVDDDVRIVEGGIDVDRFRELEVELLEDAGDDTMDVVLDRLRQAGAVVPEGRQPGKYTRALGRRRPGRTELDVKPPKARANVARVLRADLAAGADLLLRSLPGARLGDDPEAVHQARTAVRRLRATLKLFGPYLDTAWAKGLRRELRWLAGPLGEARDAEVALARLEAGAAALPEADAVAARRLTAPYLAARDAARSRLLDTLDEGRASALLDAIVDAVREPVVTARAGRRADDELARLVEASWRELRQAVREAGNDPPDEVLHRIRVLARRARFAAGSAAPLAAKEARKVAEAAATYDDVLGELFDAALAEERLRAAAASATAPVALAAGQLVAAERLAQRSARAGWR